MIKKAFFTALTALALLLANPAFGAIAYDEGEVQAVQGDPYLATFPANLSPVTCVSFVAAVQLSGATGVDIVANDPDDTTWTFRETITSGNQLFEAWTATITYDSAHVWAYFDGVGASLDDKSLNTQCYTGVTGIGATTTASGTSTAPSLALSIAQANNWLVTGFTFVGNKTWSANVGNLRDNYDGGGSGGQSASAVVDNTAASATSVTTSATLSSSDSWAGIGIELLVGSATVLQVAPTNFFSIRQR